MNSRKRDNMKTDSFFMKPNKKNNKSGDNQIDAKFQSSTSRSSKFESRNKSIGDKSSQEKQRETPEKTFDKKKWRLKKYSNKYKLQKEDEMKKKKMLQKYFKEDKNPKHFDVQKIYAEYEEDDEAIPGKSRIVEDRISKTTEEPPQKSDRIDEISSESNEHVEKGKKKLFKKAHDRYFAIKQDKIKMKEEKHRKKLEQQEAMKQYKQKKAEKYKLLNKKTRKGQPVMKGRLEMLLEKIQKSCGE